MSSKVVSRTLRIGERRVFDRLLGKRDPGPIHLPEDVTALQVVGDLHGNPDALGTLLATLDLSQPLVFVGDYVDRGQGIDRLLTVLQDLDTKPAVTCLMGNHEAMLLDFLDDPEAFGPRWLKAGGDATLHDYGLGRSSLWRDLPQLARSLHAAMGANTVQWLRDRPLWLRIGNVAIVHAAADPDRSIDDQDKKTLLWGHPAFLTHPRHDGVWVVHGHTITDRVQAQNGRIGVDTGAYQTGRLSAAEIKAPHHLRWIYTDNPLAQ